MKIGFDYNTNCCYRPNHHNHFITTKDNTKKEVVMVTPPHPPTTTSKDVIAMSDMNCNSSCSISSSSSSGGSSSDSSSSLSGDGLGNSSSNSICSTNSNSSYNAIYDNSSAIKTHVVSSNNNNMIKRTMVANNNDKVLLLPKAIKSNKNSAIKRKGNNMVTVSDNPSNSMEKQEQQQQQQNSMIERRIWSKYPTYTDYSNIPTSQALCPTIINSSLLFRTNHNITFPTILHQMISLSDQYPNEFIVPRYHRNNKNKTNSISINDKDKNVDTTMSIEQMIMKQNTLRTNYYEQQQEQVQLQNKLSKQVQQKETLNDDNDRVEYIRFCPNEIIKWENHGRSFIIIDKKLFVQYYFPLFLPYQNEYASFQRQLNLYGYIRLVNNEKCKMIIKSSSTESGNNTTSKAIIVLRYYHEKFLRTRPDITNQIQRFYLSSSNNNNKLSQSNNSNDHGKNTEQTSTDTTNLKVKKETTMSNNSIGGSSRRSRQTFDPSTEPFFEEFPPLLYHNPTTVSIGTSTSLVEANQVSMSTNTMNNSTSSPISKINIDLIMQRQPSSMNASSSFYNVGSMLKRSNSDTSIASSTHWSLNDMDDSINVNYHNNDYLLDHQFHQCSNSNENVSNTAISYQQEQEHKTDFHSLKSLELLSSSTLLVSSSSSHQQQIRERLLVKSQPNSSFKRNHYIQNQLNKQLQEEQQYKLLLNEHKESTEYQRPHHQPQEIYQHQMSCQQQQQLHEQQQQEENHHQHQRIMSALDVFPKSSPHQVESHIDDPYQHLSHQTHQFLQSQPHMIVKNGQQLLQQPQPQPQHEYQQQQQHNNMFHMESRNSTYGFLATSYAYETNYPDDHINVSNYTDHKPQEHDNYEVQSFTINENRQLHQHLSLPTSPKNQIVHSGLDGQQNSAEPDSDSIRRKRRRIDPAVQL